MVNVGGTVALTASATDANNNPVSTFGGLQWTSGNTAVATVNAGGVVTGMALGTAIVGVTDPASGASANVSVTVVAGLAPSGCAATGGRTYVQNAAAAALNANCTAGGAVASWQWYRNSVDANAGGSAIGGATSANYLPSTATPGTTYYYAVASNGSGASVTNTQAVTVNAIVAAAPSGCSGLGGGTYTLGAAAIALSASCSAGGAVASWQWYSNAANSNTGGSAIGGATNSTYIPPTTSVGTTYYYAVASNGVGSSSTNTQTVTVNTSGDYCSVYSNVVTVAGTPAILGQGIGSFAVYPDQTQVTLFPFSVLGLTNVAYIKTAEYAGASNVRTVVISSTPCGPPIDVHATSTDGYAVPLGSSSAGLITPLRADGTVYYATIYNRDAGGNPTCSDNHCSFTITFNGS
jgi:uncharacterized RmlC-like cupin family protein